jgi:AcrR family transcriptional regulator
MNSSSPHVEGRVSRRRSDARERVTEAAGQLFAERGFDETSMAMIAEAADVSVGTLYNLFANKESLFREMVHGKAMQLCARLGAALSASNGSALATIDAFLAELQASYRTEAPYIRLYFHVHDHAHVSFRAALAVETRKVYDETKAQLSAVLARGRENGEFHLNAPPARSAVAIASLASEMFFLSLSDPDDNDEGELLDEVRHIVHTGVLGLGGSPGPIHAIDDSSKETP